MRLISLPGKKGGCGGSWGEEGGKKTGIREEGGKRNLLSSYRFRWFLERGISMGVCDGIHREKRAGKPERGEVERGVKRKKTMDRSRQQMAGLAVKARTT